MRKYLFMLLAFTLTACGGGGNTGVYDDGIHKSMFGATPEKIKKRNASLTNMETMFDFSDRLIEVYKKSGINIDENSVSLPNVNVPEAFEKTYDKMSESNKLLLRKALYVQQLIMNKRHDAWGGITPTETELKDMVAWANAAYNVESRGKIKNRFNFDELKNMTADELEYTFFTKLYSAGLYRSPFMMENNYWRIDPSTGRIADDRVDDTNVFEDSYTYLDGSRDYNKNTYDMFGKLSYMDFGLVTYEEDRYSSTGEHTGHYTGKYPVWVQGPMNVSIHDIYKPTKDTWKFKGGAVGTYEKYPESHGDDRAPYILTMKTNKATLEISGNSNTGIKTVLNMPFSNWYNVKYTRDNALLGTTKTEFSNYKGKEDNRLTIDPNNGNSITVGGLVNIYVAGDYMLDPSEAGGSIAWWGDSDVFRATFGMQRVK